MSTPEAPAGWGSLTRVGQGEPGELNVEAIRQALSGGAQLFPSLRGQQQDANVRSILNLPYGVVARPASTTVPTATWTALVMTEAPEESDGIFNAATGRMRIRTPGIYQFGANVTFNNGGGVAATRGLRIQQFRGGSALTTVYLAMGAPAPANFTYMAAMTRPVRCPVGDEFEVAVFQNEGVNVIAEGHAAQLCTAWATMIGPV